jgi:hypothetical protein
MTKKASMKPAELKEFRVRLGFTQVHRLSVVLWEGGAHRIPPMLTLALKQLEREHHQAPGGTPLLQPQVS